MSESRTLRATVPEYSVEDGFSVSDSIILQPEELSMVLFVTDTPVTWARRHGSGRGRTQQICDQLENLYYNGDPVTVVTTDKTYTNMAIESLTISKSTEVGYAREIPISFKKIRTTSARTTSIPASYGKSGVSGASAGTASTSSGSSGSRSSSSGSGSGNKSSILYGAANSLGLFK